MKDQTPIRKKETGLISMDYNWVEKPLRQALADRPAHQPAVSIATLAMAQWRNRHLRMQANALKLVRLRILLGGVTFLAAGMIAAIVWRAVASIESVLQSASVSTTSGTTASTTLTAVQQGSGTTSTLTLLAAWTPTVAALLMLAGLLLVLHRLFSPDSFNPARPAAWF